MSFYKHFFFSFTGTLGRRSCRKFLSDSCTACRCALLYARRTAPRRHTATAPTRRRVVKTHFWSKRDIPRVTTFFKCSPQNTSSPSLRLCETTQELVRTDGSHPSFFSKGISLLLSFSRTSCNASIWQSKQHEIHQKYLKRTKKKEWICEGVSHQVFLLLGFHGEVRGTRLQRGVIGGGQPWAAAAGDHHEEGSGSDHGPGGMDLLGSVYVEVSGVPFMLYILQKPPVTSASVWNIHGGLLTRVTSISTFASRVERRRDGGDFSFQKTYLSK